MVRSFFQEFLQVSDFAAQFGSCSGAPNPSKKIPAETDSTLCYQLAFRGGAAVPRRIALWYAASTGGHLLREFADSHFTLAQNL